MTVYFQPPTRLLDFKNFKVMLNKKIKPFPPGKANGSIEVNNEFQVDKQHNGKRWMRILCKVVISSPVHKRDTIFTVERSLYFDCLDDNQESHDHLLSEIKKVYREINRVKDNHMDKKVFGGPISIPSDEVFLKEIKSFLSTFFFSAPTAKIMAN